jgi:hypothetical protein
MKFPWPVQHDGCLVGRDGEDIRLLRRNGKDEKGQQQQRGSRASHKHKPSCITHFCHGSAGCSAPSRVEHYVFVNALQAEASLGCRWVYRFRPTIANTF